MILSDAVVRVDGVSSEATIVRTNVYDIDTTSLGTSWRGFYGDNGALLSVSDSTFSNTAGSRTLLSASANAALTMNRVEIMDSVGYQVVVSQL